MITKCLKHLVYMLRTIPCLWTVRQISPHSRSLSFRKCPTCSEWTTSQNTQISACSLWMLALHVGNCDIWIKWLTNRHSCREEEHITKIFLRKLLTSFWQQKNMQPHHKTSIEVDYFEVRMEPKLLLHWLPVWLMCNSTHFVFERHKHLPKWPFWPNTCGSVHVMPSYFLWAFI